MTFIPSLSLITVIDVFWVRIGIIVYFVIENRVWYDGESEFVWFRSRNPYCKFNVQPKSKNMKIKVTFETHGEEITLPVP